ncbi:MAG: hypothetical protein LBU65_07405 [Planctomycetaceae bacterium]|jgi:hypothetical protein|nr:hypothetical protein [Planctomycetaceae bacterium]
MSELCSDTPKRRGLEFLLLTRLLTAGLFFVTTGAIGYFVFSRLLVATTVVGVGILLSVVAVYIVRKSGNSPIGELPVAMVFRIGLPIGFVMFGYSTVADTQSLHIFFGEVVVVYLISLPLGIWLVRP